MQYLCGNISYGLNLQEASTMFYEMAATVNKILQAKARVIRIGQSKRCSIYYFDTLNMVEEDVYFTHFSKKVELSSILVTETFKC